jgi:hypothetical protein
MNKYCLNCNKVGHIAKKCNKPITSYGIICFNNSNMINIVDKLETNKFININDYNYYNIYNINKFCNYYDDIKFLMIRRKHSLTYIEFIRGKYDLENIHNIDNLFQLMSRNENIKIKTQSFDELWNDLWMQTAHNHIYRKEYIIAKNNFNKLKEHNFYELLNENNLSKYTEPEWGFPKGRKNFNEDIRSCAMREFIEETNIKDCVMLNKINQIEETYVGTNNITYKNIYYLGYNKDITLDFNYSNSYEIGDIEWVSLHNSINKFRHYETTKKDLLLSVYFFIVNIYENNKN